MPKKNYFNEIRFVSEKVHQRLMNNEACNFQEINKMDNRIMRKYGIT